MSLDLDFSAAALKPQLSPHSRSPRYSPRVAQHCAVSGCSNDRLPGGRGYCSQHRGGRPVDSKSLDSTSVSPLPSPRASPRAKACAVAECPNARDKLFRAYCSKHGKELVGTVKNWERVKIDTPLLHFNFMFVVSVFSILWWLSHQYYYIITTNLRHVHIPTHSTR